jgi:hypothetical protein
MASEWQLIVSGTAVPFDQYGAIVTGMQGVGMAPVRNVISPYALSPGGAHQRTKVESRSVILQAVLPGTSIANLHQLRARLIEVLRPDRDATQQPVTLRYTGGSATVDLQAYYDAGLEWSNPVGYTEALALRFIAPDPYWRGTADTAGFLAAGSISPMKNIAIEQSTGWSFAPGVSAEPTAFTYSGKIKRITTTDGGSGLLAFTLNSGTSSFVSFYKNNVFGSFSKTTIARWDGVDWSSYAGTMPTGNNFPIQCAVKSGETIWVLATNAVNETASASSRGTVFFYPYRWTQSDGWLSAGTYSASSFESRRINVDALYKSVNDGEVYLAIGNYNNPGSVSVPSPLLVSRSNGLGGWEFAPFDLDLVLAPASTSCINYIFDTPSALYMALVPSPNGVMLPESKGGTFQSSIIYQQRLTGVWQSLGTAQGGAGDVSLAAIAISGEGVVYVGGGFTSLAGGSVSYVARYNGSQWESVGSLNGRVMDLQYDTKRDRLYATGVFTTADGKTTPNGIAYWTKEAWYVPEPILPTFAHTPSTTSSRVRTTMIEDGSVLVHGVSSGTAVVPGKTTISVQGKARTSPVITIAGQGELGQIANLVTGDRMFFQNLLLISQEVVTLDFNLGVFTSNIRGNITPYIRAGSRLIGWSFIPGNNIITISSPNAGTFTASYTCRDRYWSIDT